MILFFVSPYLFLSISIRILRGTHDPIEEETKGGLRVIVCAPGGGRLRPGRAFAPWAGVFAPLCTRDVPRKGLFLRYPFRMRDTVHDTYGTGR